MKLTAYVVDGHSIDIRPAPLERDWMDNTEQRYAYRCLPLSIANAHGWEILCAAGFTFPSQTVSVSGSGAGDGSSRRRGSGASGATRIVANGRTGSFSPAGPVSTLRVMKLALAPGGKPLTMNSTRLAGGNTLANNPVRRRSGSKRRMWETFRVGGWAKAYRARWGRSKNLPPRPPSLPGG